MLVENTPISALIPDDKNPRKADDARLSLLRLSLAKLGFIEAVPTVAEGCCLCGCGGLVNAGCKYVKGHHKRLGMHERLVGKAKYDHTTGCIEWMGKLSNGYGRASVLGRDYLVHRLSYEYYVGPIPEGLHILHRCDNPKCFNPEHLSIGTPLDNIRDAADKNRMRHGSKHHAAKLTEEDARYIKQSTKKHVDLAKQFNVHPVTIIDVRAGRTWRTA